MLQEVSELLASGGWSSRRRGVPGPAARALKRPPPLAQ